MLTPEQGALAELYPHDLQMYIVPPINDISLSEFQELAVSRLTGRPMFSSLNKDLA